MLQYIEQTRDSEDFAVLSGNDSLFSGTFWQGDRRYCGLRQRVP
ncbi:MAG: hypothetical protein ACLUOI_38520 [Eisenbergiella sp.]